MRTIFLLDIDCFFASVEMALRPELRGKPLCVGGHRGDRGIVACPNYEARAYGVKTAMPLRSAEKLLPPEAVFIPGNYRAYGEYSERVMTLLEEFTPDVEQVSVDEAYMDVTGCLHFWGGDPLRMAAAMQERIWRACGLSVSIGIAANRVCAKIAASLKKPGGLVTVPAGREREFLSPLPVEVIPGVGVRTLPRMHVQGIFTVGDLLERKTPPRSYVGPSFALIAGGRDATAVHRHGPEKSISRDTTFGRDTADGDMIGSTLYYLVERCCKTMRRQERSAATVTVKVRFADFTTVQKQSTLAVATANEEEIFAAALRLLRTLRRPGAVIRLVGVKVSHLSGGKQEGAQMVLGVVQGERLAALHRRVDALQEKHGYATIQWGITYALRKTARASDNGYELHNAVYGM